MGKIHPNFKHWLLVFNGLLGKTNLLINAKGTERNAEVSKYNWATFACFFLGVFAFDDLFVIPYCWFTQRAQREMQRAQSSTGRPWE